MRWMVLFPAILLAVMPLAAQTSNLEIDTSTPEGQLLQQIGTTEDVSQKVQLLEQFTQQYPGHAAMAWVLNQLPPAYASLNQADNSLAACGKMLEKSPANAAGAHGCLKTAEAQKNPELVRKWALATRAAATKAVEAPKPKFEYEDEEQEWNQNVKFAEQVGSYSEWSLYNAALQATDPTQKLALIAALKEANPKSEYVGQLTTQAFMALRQAGQVEQAVAMVEEAMAEDKADEDMLLVAADYYFNQKKDSAKTLEYAGKLVEMMETKAAPEGITPEVWEAKKEASLGMGYWFMGVTFSTQKKYSDTDQMMRKAMPYVGDNVQLKAATLFHLGVANFQLGSQGGNEKRILDAFNFTKECAAIKSPFQAQAQKNLKAIQTQYRIK